MRALVTALLLAGTLLVSAGASAEDAPAAVEDAAPAEETAAEERAAQFVGVTGPEAESISGGALLLGAYAIVWILLFLYLMRMRGLQRQTAEELERLSAAIRASEGP
jgi:CcmD family protein